MQLGGQIKKALGAADKKNKAHESKCAASWKEWAANAFLQGTKQSRRFTKAKPIQDIMKACTGETIAELADNELNQWENIEFARAGRIHSTRRDGRRLDGVTDHYN